MALLNPGMAGAPQGLQAAYLRDPRLRLAQQLQLQGADTSPVQHWTQGAARLAQALAGNYVQDRADRQYQEQADQYATERQSLYAPVMVPGASGPGPRADATTRAATPGEMLARAQNLRSPYLQDDIRMIQQQAMAAEAERNKPFNLRPGERRYGPGIAVIGADGRALAGIVYHEFNEQAATVQLSMAAESPMWATRGTIRALLSVPFEQFHCFKVWTATPQANTRALKVNEHIGFKREATLAHHYGKGIHAIICRMLAPDYARRYGN